jgi:simple sugar transport system ATP-binding protein
MEAQASQILDRLHIHFDSVRRPVEYLSGGQRQAVAIGRATGFDARVLIMDEPTANLAVKEAGKVLEFARDARHGGISTIFISHRLQDIFAIGDRVMVLKRGQCVGVRRIAETTMDEVVNLIVKGTA